jgi:phosphoribosyl 1,2-cyclic phosphodiesterase
MSSTSSMTIQFWGVRGSTPTPGPLTVRYGGNTACVSIDLGPETILVLDAGTGIRALGKAIADSRADIFVLLSHAHWDHIQGFPFFQPIYDPHRTIYVFPTLQVQSLWCSVLEQMDGAHFPVTPDNLPSNTQCITEGMSTFLQDHGIYISRIATNHPGGGSGYRLEREGRSVVYLTDNELEPPYKKTTSFDAFVQFCQHADVLIHDAQYLESDMPHKHGWGHSLVSHVQELAAAANVHHLILFHHDPDRTDEELDAMQDATQDWLRQQSSPVQCTVAFEGLTINMAPEGIALDTTVASPSIEIVGGNTHKR